MRLVEAVRSRVGRRAFPFIGQLTLDQFGSSTGWNTQGSVQPIPTDVSIFQSSAYGGNGNPNTGSISFGWSAFDLYRPDGSDISVGLAGVILANPPAPTISQVAGGSLGARTYHVKIGYTRNGMCYPIGSGSTLALSANNLLRVASPASVAGYDGWYVVVDNGSGTPYVQYPSGNFVIPFGTNYTEPTSAVTTNTTPATWLGDIALVGVGASTQYFFYPFWDLVSGFPAFGLPANTRTGPDPAAARDQNADGHVALSGFGGGATAGAITVTTPPATYTASGSVGGGILT